MVNMAEQRHKKMYTLQEKIAALEVMRMCGGNRQAAVRQMQAQGIHITYAALRKWEKKAHLGGTILREEAPLVNTAAQGQVAQIVDEAHAGMMTYAAKAAQTLCSALDLKSVRELT
jgi:hypothetical protein